MATRKTAKSTKARAPARPKAEDAQAPTSTRTMWKGAISFGLGRTIMHLRNKKRRKQAEEQKAQALRNRPDEPESKNRSKRKRQLQQMSKGARKP